MGADLKNITNPVRDWRVVNSLAQSESANSLIVKPINFCCEALGGNYSLHSSYALSDQSSQTKWDFSMSGSVG